MNKLKCLSLLIAAGFIMAGCTPTTVVEPQPGMGGPGPRGPVPHSVWVPGHYNYNGGWVPGHYNYVG